MPIESVPRVPADRREAPDTTEQLACCRRVKGYLREAVADLEQTFGADVALIVIAGAMRAAGEVERLAQRIQREADGGNL